MSAAVAAPRRRTIRSLDMFCWAGGSSSGLAYACKDLDLTLQLTAVNHWHVAIETHSANHPEARHHCANVYRLDPRKAVRGGKLDLLIASPTCTFYSRARGGKPVSHGQKYGRMTPTQVVRWAKELTPNAILVENVPELVQWGPVDRETEKPIKAKAGMYFRRWVARLKRLGYVVEHKVLCAADYGDPTTRKRFFLIGRRDGKPIAWPWPSHAKFPSLFGLKPWVPAKEIIDWSVPGKSIFFRKTPLRPATLRRIYAGVEKFGGPELEPFLVILRGTSTVRSINEPVPSLTAGGGHVGVAQPFLMHITHGQDAGRVHSVEAPVPTITTANRGEIALIQPFLLSQQSGGAPRSTNSPVPTVAGAGAIGLAQPFLVPFRCDSDGRQPRTLSVENPLPTVVADGAGFGLVQPFIIVNRTNNIPKSIDEPLPALCTGNHMALVRPFLTKYYGTALAVPVDEPLPSITTKDRFGLVMPVVNGLALDILFRMLMTRELAKAMSFCDSYRFSGTKGEQVRQIGNSVPVRLSRALCHTIAGSL